jgi:arabinofuranosyltransferase
MGNAAIATNRVRSRLEVAAIGRWAALAAPAVFVGVMGWTRRWVAEDAFIDLRVVTNILDGHGPVFNPGERVEAFTSPLWVAILTVFGGLERLGLPISIELTTVLLGLVCTVAAVAVGVVASARLQALGKERSSVLLPAGAAVFVALSGTWDFVTSGLETSLVVLWIALCFLGVARLAAARAARPSYRLFLLLGLGPLVRPDLVLFAAAFLAAVVVLGRPWRRRDLALRVAAGLATPVLYELLRAGYYGALVPNTALAKEAARSNLHQGLLYLHDFAVAYQLWWPVVAGAILTLVLLPDRWRGEHSRYVVAGAAPVVGGALSALYVVRLGGDFMHARMLLPAAFGLCLALFVVPVTRRTGVLVAALLVYAVAAAAWLHPPWTRFFPQGIANERAFYVIWSHAQHPVYPADYRRLSWSAWGREAHARAAEHEQVVLVPAHLYHLPHLLPGVRRQVVFAFPNVGISGYLAGPRVRIVDLYGLADPIGSRMSMPERGRPGHEKHLPLDLFLGRYVASSTIPARQRRIEAGRASLRCPGLRKLLAAVEKPMSFHRFFANVADSWALTRERIPFRPADRTCS